MRIAIDATTALVALGGLFIVGTGAWLIVGSFLFWAVWQVVAFYAVLVVLASVMYGALHLAVRGGEESSRDRVIG
jgi:hypothetical protein